MLFDVALLCFISLVLAVIILVLRNAFHGHRVRVVDQEHAHPTTSSYNKTSSAFRAARLTKTTFVIQEFDDIFNEHPLLYAKLIPAATTIVLIDTGCGGKSKTDVKVTRLKDFFATVGVPANGGRPLNENSRAGYVVVLTHCHYDHILAVEQFADAHRIIASGNDPSFISQSNLSKHSLCSELGIKTPKYTPTLVPHFYQLKSNGVMLDVQILHTPGHTPDELAIYDQADRILYVGDTLYERAPIIFPNEGSIIRWLDSVDHLISFVQARDQPQRKILICCGHATCGALAMDVLVSAKKFMQDVLRGVEVVKERYEKRGEVFVSFKQNSGRFSLLCPERLVIEARFCEITL